MPRIAPRPAVAVGVQVAGAVAVDGGGGASIVLRPSPTPLSRVLPSLPRMHFKHQTENRSKHTSRKRKDTTKKEVAATSRS